MNYLFLNEQFWTFLTPSRQVNVAGMDDQRVSLSSPQHSAGAAGADRQRPGRPSVVRCGWLRKQGGFVKTWHSRWFVLRGDQLYYYKDEEETKALVRLRTHTPHTHTPHTHSNPNWSWKHSTAGSTDLPSDHLVLGRESCRSAFEQLSS